MIDMEVCVDSTKSTIHANNSKAKRIELCTDLINGGITPSYGLIKKVREITDLKMTVLIRPRPGDFNYTDDEFDIMIQDIKICSELGVDGVSFGILKIDGQVDFERCQMMFQFAKKLQLECTFHRAFDMTRDAVESVQLLIQIGFDRVLTSGFEADSLSGLALIRQISEAARGRILIVPAGGVTEDNVALILQEAQLNQFHVSAKVELDSQMEYRNLKVSMGGNTVQGEYVYFEASETRLANYFRNFD